MGLGLLGALQGAGQSMTQFGNALFAEETERQRQADLQKIRDTDYKRARADQLKDQQTGFDREDAVIAERNTREDANYKRDRADTLADDLRNRTRQLADVAEARGWQVEDRKNTYTNFEVDDTGAVIGFNSVGDSKEVGKLANMNPILGDAVDAYQYTLRQINDLNATREDAEYADLFDSLDRYQRYMNAGFESSAANMGLDTDGPMQTEDAVGLGRLLFNGQNEADLDGTIISGQDLIDARFDYGQRYPSLLELIQR